MKYEELPKWIQDFLFYHHDHVLLHDDFKGKKYDDDGLPTDEYDEYFDENQEIYYNEECILQMIDCLLNNKKITYL